MKSVWEKAGWGNVGKLILSGASGVEEEDGFYPAEKFISWMNPDHKKILDFGTGIGRNIFSLADKYKEVHGFDFPNMISMLKENRRLEVYQNIKAYTEWEEVRFQQYDAIFACLVIQHIEPKAVEAYLKDFKKMTHTLYLCTRSYMDFTGNLVYGLLQEDWKVVDVHEIASSLEDAITYIKDAKGEDHYECLLVNKGRE